MAGPAVRPGWEGPTGKVVRTEPSGRITPFIPPHYFVAWTRAPLHEL